MCWMKTVVLGSAAIWRCALEPMLDELAVLESTDAVPEKPWSGAFQSP